jgi:hypothetical protein
MTTPTQTNKHNEYTHTAAMTVPFEEIQEPGCYICNWSGHLLRVPEDGVAPGRSPLISINPFVTVTKAKMIASNLDCNVNF